MSENPYAPPQSEVSESTSDEIRMAITNSASPARKRGFWRGIIFSYIAKWLALLVLFAVTFVVRPFIWPLLYHTAYTRAPGPMIIGTGEWFYTQCIGLLASIASGYAAVYWSKPRSWWALGALAVLALVSSLLQIPNASTMMLLIWFLEAPAGILIGAALGTYHERKT